MQLTICAGLCRRRHWPEPLYDSAVYSSGFACVVRVNNREYQTDTVYESQALAEENAAMRAYLICRNFSVNDGMYPAGHDHGGIPQGFPVAIGTGRRNRYSEEPSSSNDSGSSPESHEGRRLHRSEQRRTNGPTRALAYGKRTHNHF